MYTFLLIIATAIIIIICIIITIIIKHDEVNSSHYRKNMRDVFKRNIKKCYSAVDKMFFLHQHCTKRSFVLLQTSEGGRHYVHHGNYVFTFLALLPL